MAPEVAAAAQTAGPGISASPKLVSCATGRGSTTITWNAGGYSTAEVWVSVNGAKEMLFAGLSGSGVQGLDWISAGSTYDFRLYEGAAHTKVLGSAEVRCAAEPAFIRAIPNPVQTDRTGSNGQTRIEWNTGNGKPGKVTLSINGGNELLVMNGARGALDVSYIRRDNQFTYRLYDESHLEAEVRVRARLTRPRLVARLTFVACLVLLIAGSYAGGDPAAFRRKVAPGLAAAMTVAALMPILLADAKPLAEQPFPDSHEYADGARQIVSGKGYVTYVHDNDTWPDDGQARPPRYPPGFSLALVPFAFFGTYPDDVLDAAKWFAVLYLLAVVAAAWSIGGPLAAMLAAGLVGISPFGEQSGNVLLADTFGAALTVLLVPLLNKPSAVRSAMAGLVAGIAVLVKFSMIVNIAALALALRGRARRVALLSAVPALAGLLLYQWLTFGGPLKTGYGYWSPERKRFNPIYAVMLVDRPPGTAFSDALHGKLMRWACPCPLPGPQLALPNYIFYPAVLSGFFWIFSPPLVTFAGLFYLRRNWRGPPETAAICVIVLTFVLYIGHVYQSERFVASAATLLTVYTSVSLAKWIEKRSAPTRA
jgi:hypothetical protein